MRKLVQWVGDYLLHHEDEHKLLGGLHAFLTVCVECNFRLHARMSCFFTLGGISEEDFCWMHKYGTTHETSRLYSI